ncbi:hypothetical protein [Pseudomonas caspiana]|uniref:hypothetical protein n=1 Tax=Pseudomonas caspiana TaxID=1451454 RepID=UPI00130257FA
MNLTKPLAPYRQARRSVINLCANLLWAGVLLVSFASAQPQVIPVSTDAAAQPLPDLTSEELAQRIVRLTLSIHGKQDMARIQVEKKFGVMLKYNATDPQEFWISDERVGGTGYSLESISDAKGQPVSRLDFKFPQSAVAPGQATCTQTIGLYHQSLVDGGFTAEWVGSPRRGTPARWHFERGNVVVTVLVSADAHKEDTQACVSNLMVLAVS